MGSLVLQEQHPHFQLNQVRRKAQSQILRGSASSAWGAGEMVGAAPLHLTQSPRQMSNTGQPRGSVFQKPSSGNWGQGVPSQGGNV